MKRAIVGVFALAALFVPCAAAAAPGDTAAAERARLARDNGLAPPQARDGSQSQWVTHDREQDPLNLPDFSWTFAYTLENGRVSRETFSVRSLDRTFVTRRDAPQFLARLDGAALRGDFARSAVVARQSDDPAVHQEFARGKQFAYRSVDDERNHLHLLEVMPQDGLAAEIRDFNAIPVVAAAAPSTRTVDDPLYAIDDLGKFDPIGIVRGTAVGPPDPARARAAIVRAGGNVHLVFGRQTIATLRVVDDRAAGAALVPASLPLGNRVAALISPTLGGTSRDARHAPSAADRSAVLALAARVLHADADALEARLVTQIDLGHGPAILGAVVARGTDEPRTDRRLFFIAERRDGAYALTLARLQTMTSTEPLLEESGEFPVDAIDLRDGSTIVVTRAVGFDAHEYNVYARAGARWKKIYTGGGAAG